MRPARPNTATLNQFDLYWDIEDLGRALWTFPAGTPDRQLDYVLYRKSGDWTVHDVEVLNEPVAWAGSVVRGWQAGE